MQVFVPIAALLLSVAFLVTGYGLQGVLLPVRASLEDFSTIEIGLIASSYFTGFAAGCLHGPRLVKAVGHIRTFTAMAGLAAAIGLGHAFAPVPAVWWVLRAGFGFCSAVLFMVIESWLNERSTRETRGMVLSAYMIINLTMLSLGQMVLPLGDPDGMELFAVVGILISLAAVPVALTTSPAPAPIKTTRVRLRRLYAISPAAVVGCFCVGLANSSFWALAPIFARESGFAETGIALFMSVAVLGGALGQWPLGRLSDRSDRRRVILLAATISVAAAILMVFPPFASDGALLVTAALWGAAAFPLYSLSISHANDHAAPEDFVETASGLLLVFAAGAVLGPLLASAITGMFGPGSLFAYPAAVHVGLIGFLAWRIARNAPVPPAEQAEFVDAFCAASTVSTVFDEAIQSELQSAHEPDPPTPQEEPVETLQ